MNIRYITSNNYLYNKIFLFNHFDIVYLDKNLVHKKSIIHLMKNLNKNNRNVTLLEDDNNYIIKKLSNTFNIKIYKN